MEEFEDFILGTESNDILPGTTDADTIIGFAGDDTINGALGDDILSGNAGQDRLSGEDGNDLIVAGRDADLVEGNSGDDILAGNLGIDTIYGGEGNDLLLGGQDDDFLDGGVGNDTLVGDFGINGYFGGEGADVFVPRTDVALADPDRVPTDRGALTDVIVDFTPGEDRIGLTDGLTEANLTIVSVSAPLDQLDLSLAPEGIDPVALLDPDGDGFVPTALGLINGGPVLFAALNTAPEQLSGQFISA